MQIDELKELVVDALDDLKAKDIVTINVRGKSDMTDVMVIASGTSSRQVKGLAENVRMRAKESGIEALGVEGDDVGEWVLVDLGDIVVHVMQEPVRRFYQLERLWSVTEEKQAGEQK